MAMYKVTFFFNKSYFGASETWWREAANAAALVTPIQQYLAFRLAMLVPQVTVTGVRVAIDGNPRVGFALLPGINNLSETGPTFNVPFTGTATTAQFPTQSDQWRAILQTRVYANGQAQGIRYISGIPDETSKTEPAVTDFSNPPGWWLAYNAWVAYLAGNGWRVKCLDKSDGNPEYPVRGWVQQTAAPNLLGAVLTLAGAPDVDTPDRVLIRRVRMKAQGFKSPNGTWVIQSAVDDAVAGTSTFYFYNTSNLAVGQIKLPGKLRVQKYAYYAVETLDAWRVGTHARGGPFVRPRGRRSVQRYG